MDAREVLEGIWSLNVPHGEQVVLLAMVDLANDAGEVEVTREFIAARTGYDARHVQRLIRSLLNRGALELVRPGLGRGHGAVYRHAFPEELYRGLYEPRAELAAGPRRRLLEGLLERYGPVCLYCGHAGTAEAGPDGRPWQIDRIVPGAAGGRYIPENVALACGPCNSRKGARYEH